MNGKKPTYVSDCLNCDKTILRSQGTYFTYVSGPTTSGGFVCKECQQKWREEPAMPLIDPIETDSMDELDAK